MSTPRILIIDDEPPIRRLLRTGLATQGYEIIRGARRSAALDVLARERPDLIILDLGLPDIAGTISCAASARGIRTCRSLSCRAARRGRQGRGPRPRRRRLRHQAFGMDELIARIRTALRHQLAVQGERAGIRSRRSRVDLVRRIVARKWEPR